MKRNRGKESEAMANNEQHVSSTTNSLVLGQSQVSIGIIPMAVEVCRVKK